MSKKIALFQISGPIRPWDRPVAKPGTFEVLSKQMANFMNSKDSKSIEPIILISSHGGSLDAAIQIYEYLKLFPLFAEQIDYAKGNITMISKVRLHNDIKDKESKSSLSSAIYMIDKHEGKPMQAVKIDKDSSINIVVKSYKE